MAAYLQGRGIASAGKRLVNQISYAGTPNPSLSSSFLLRRALHVSLYDKNPEEHVHATVVPDHVIGSDSEKYWAPHPQTGVFGPPSDQNLPASDRGFNISVDSATEASVLEQKTFFRPLEDLDLEKPHPHA